MCVCMCYPKTTFTNLFVHFNCFKIFIDKGLSVSNLNIMLHDLVEWEPFAIELPKISITDVEIIKRDHPFNVIDQKLALYRKWLQVSPNASYSDVVKALRMIKENNMAMKVQKNVSHEDMFIPEQHSGPRLHEAFNVLKSILEILNEPHKSLFLRSCEIQSKSKDIEPHKGQGSLTPHLTGRM